MKNTRSAAILVIIAAGALLVGFFGWGPIPSVFLYPENWLSPDVRDNETEFFQPIDEHPIRGALVVSTILLVAAFALTA